MEDNYIQTAIDMLAPVMESSMIIAAQYTKACGRNTVTSMDVQYGMKYCTQTVAGKQIGSLFPELDNSDEDEDEESDADEIEEVDEDDEPFTRYSGDDEIMNAVNKCYDEWEQWVPYSPLEKMLKSAVDKSS